MYAKYTPASTIARTTTPIAYDEIVWCPKAADRDVHHLRLKGVFALSLLEVKRPQRRFFAFEHGAKAEIFLLQRFDADPLGVDTPLHIFHGGLRRRRF